MCLGVPGRIVEITHEAPLRTGRVDFGGIAKDVCLFYVPEAQPGDYVLVHVGFALSRIDEEEARRTLESLRRAGQLAKLEAGEEGAP
jgi:hydrogenase expression/formation protein HypC